MNSRKDESIPICIGDCIKVLKIEYCYKGLFEPDNTQDEVNFANYDQIINQEFNKNNSYVPFNSENNIDTNLKNTMSNMIKHQQINNGFNYNFVQKKEKNKNGEGFNKREYYNKNDNLLENNIIDNDRKSFSEKNLSLLEKLSNDNKNRLESESSKFITESLENKLTSEFMFNRFNNNLSKNENFDSDSLNINTDKTEKSLLHSLEGDCDESKNVVNGIQKIIPLENNPTLNYIPKSYTNYPSDIDLEENSRKIFKKVEKISKDVFNSLLSNEIKSRKKPNFIKANLDIESKSDDYLLNSLKEYVPNFEFPQFLKSDLEQSINEIKREKLLLWLRGFSLNENISKLHLPIYQNLLFTNEENIRKMYLDKFYKEIVNDPKVNINSVIYKNMLGNSGSIIPHVDNSKSIGKKLKDIIKNFKVIDSNYIDKTDLVGLVKQSNMRFKEKSSNNKFENKKKDAISENNIINEININQNRNKIKEISNQLKNFLKQLK